MKYIKQLIAIAIAVGILLATATASLYFFSLGLKQPTPVPVEESSLTIDSLLKEVNEQRAKAGVAPLMANPLLNQSAQIKADEIEQTGIYDHVNSNGKHGYEFINDVGVQCVHISENLTADTTTTGAISDWMGSEAHRLAMLNPIYDATGFGISQGPGYQYIVQHFCDLP